MPNDFISQSVETSLSLGQVHFAVDVLDKANWLNPSSRLPVALKVRLSCLNTVSAAILPELKRNKDADLLLRSYKVVAALVQLERCK